MPDEPTTPAAEANPPAPQPPAAAEPAPPISKVDRALSAEVEALRRQVAALPDAEEIERLRARAALADEIEAGLPQWRQELAGAVEAQQAAGQAAVQEVQADLARAKADRDAAAAFFAAGGNEAGWEVLRQTVAKDVQRAEDGTLVVPTADGLQPLGDVLQGLSDHPIYAACFAPRYGSGGGSRSGLSARAVPGVDVSKLSTQEKFARAFGRNR